LIPYTDLQRREAAEWFLVIHDKVEPKPDSLQAWLRWMEQDVGNRLAFESVAEAWHAISPASPVAMPTAQELAADEYNGEQSVEEWLEQRSAIAIPALTAPSLPHRRLISPPRRRVWLAAASFAALMLGVLAMFRHLDSTVSQADEFATKAGEQLQITLADGSQVWLGPKSTLVVAFTRERRSMQLATGEAFFSVHKDPARPFIVRSVGGDITAVGTAFNVRAVDDRVTVAVSEGAVTVAPVIPAAATIPTEARPAEVRIGSGQEVTFRARQPVQALTVKQTPTPGERARWRDGVLVYRDEPLRDVVMDVVRYSKKHIEISDAAIGELHYSGVVYKTAVDEWTEALPESFPVKIISDGNRVIIEAR
jgi:transmembrane sensor